MSTVLKGALGTSVLAAVRGKMKAKRMSDDDRAENPENLEDDRDAESDEPDAEADDTDAETEDPDAESEDPEAEVDDTDAETDDPDLEDEEKAKSARVRRAEQKRIHAILTHPKAEANPGLAAELAFGARHYSKSEAVSLLSAGGSGGRLASRMAGKSPKIGSSAPAQPGNERKALVDSVRANIQARHRVRS